MTPNKNNMDIATKAWLSEMRPQFLAVIEEADEMLKTFNRCDNVDKNTLKCVASKKAFYICACNADIAGCRQWFGKFKDRGLKELERIQESKKKCVRFNFADDIWTAIEGQDVVYMELAKEMKEEYLTMEHVLKQME